MIKRNELKNMIYIQDNKPCNEQTIKGLFRSIAEATLDGKAEGVALLRFGEKSKKDFNSILKRFEYSLLDIYDFSEEPINDEFEYVLKENIWDTTEFVFVLTKRFGVSFIFDYDASETEGHAGVYLLYNSKFLPDSFEIMNSNSTKDLSAYNENLHPDRRDNDVLNLSIMKLVSILNETYQEKLISEMEKEHVEDNEEAKELYDFIAAKSSYVAHEIRNQLSICTLYSDVIQKQLHKMPSECENTQKSFQNAINCIQKSLQMAGNTLLDLKSLKGNELKEYSLEELTKTAINLAQVYINEKNINLEYENVSKARILADGNKFLAVMINLIKNAVENIDYEGQIKIVNEEDNENVKIIVLNTGKPIEEEFKNKIFEEGYTTKTSGSGLGLTICKKSLEEQFARLSLRKSDESSTEFEITLPKLQ